MWPFNKYAKHRFKCLSARACGVLLENIYFLPIPLVKQENYFPGKGKPTQPATGVVKKAYVFYLLFLSSRSRQSLARLFSILVLRICSRQQTQMPAKLKCKDMKFYWRPLELKTRTGFNLRFFLRLLKKKTLRKVPLFFLFTRKVALFLLLKEVKPSPKL